MSKLVLHRPAQEFQQQTSGVAYDRKTPEQNAVIAAVFQGGYAFAHGPRDGINYLGTFGLNPCVGLAVVTRVTGEHYPRVSVAHIDALSEMDRSIAAILDGNGHKDGGHTDVTLIGGQQGAKEIAKITYILERRGITPGYDIAGSGIKTLIFDLSTGRAVNPEPFQSTPWLMRLENRLAERKTQQPLRKEFDLRNGRPEGYTARPINNFPRFFDPETGYFRIPM